MREIREQRRASIQSWLDANPWFDKSRALALIAQGLFEIAPGQTEKEKLEWTASEVRRLWPEEVAKAEASASPSSSSISILGRLVLLEAAARGCGLGLAVEGSAGASGAGSSMAGRSSSSSATMTLFGRTLQSRQG